MPGQPIEPASSNAAGTEDRDDTLRRWGVGEERFNIETFDERPPPEPAPVEAPPPDPGVAAWSQAMAEQRRQQEEFMTRVQAPAPQRLPEQPQMPQVSWDDFDVPEEIAARFQDDPRAAARALGQAVLSHATPRFQQAIAQAQQNAAQWGAAQAQNAIAGAQMAAQRAPTWASLAVEDQQARITELARDPSFVSAPYETKLQRLEARTGEWLTSLTNRRQQGSSVRTDLGGGGAREPQRPRVDPDDQSAQMMHMLRTARK